MLKWFKSRRKKTAAPDFRIHELQLGELNPMSFTVDDMLEVREGGFIVRNFLSSEEARQITRKFQDLPSGMVAEVYEGFKTYPKSFSQSEEAVLSGKVSPENYHAGAMEFRNGFASNFGLDVEGRIRSVFASLWPKMSLEVARDRDAFGSFMPFTFREMRPGPGFLISHCGKLFSRGHQGFYDRLSHFTENDHQISFFMVLQSAEAGGELTLYDLLWKDVQNRPVPGTVVTLEGKELNLEDPVEVPQEKLNLQVGDLLVFNGGDIWHRVEYVKGSRSRITLGGFLSLSPDHQEIFMWA